MSFKLCNTLLTFITLMDSISHEKLDKFIIVYIDNILVYFRIVKEHVGHLEYILRKLNENQFFVNHAKSEYAYENGLPWACIVLDEIKSQSKEAQGHKVLTKANYNQRRYIIFGFNKLLLKVH